MPKPPEARQEAGARVRGVVDPVDRARGLAGLFCSPVERFGGFRSVPAELVPEHFRRLLDHRSHMTAAMERCHGGPLGLRIASVMAGQPAGGAGPGTDASYAREILLLGPAGQIVQHGIVRIDLMCVGPEVAAAIRAGRVPLGRILIDAGLLRDVQRVELLEVQAGPHLAGLFGIDIATRPPAAGGCVTFGRVADISLDGRPAVELLEIVAPRGS